MARLAGCDKEDVDCITAAGGHAEVELTASPDVVLHPPAVLPVGCCKGKYCLDIE